MRRLPDGSGYGQGRLDRMCPTSNANGQTGARPSSHSFHTLWLRPSARLAGARIGALEMLSLPTELWLLIGVYLCRRDLLAAVQVNHTLHSQLIPLLYRNFIICGFHTPWRGNTTCPKPSVPPPFVERSFAIIERLKMIQSSSTLMGAIKSCTLCHFPDLPIEATTADALKQVLEEGVAFISKLPHCCDIVIDAVHISSRQLKQLIPRHYQPANLSVRSVAILDGDSTHTSGSQHQYPLKSLTISGLKGSEESIREFAEWSMSGDLQSLSVQSIFWNFLPFFHVQLVQRSFPNLRRLDFSRCLTTTQFLEYLPMLEELALPSTSPLVLTPTILPRLRTFEGSGNQARYIVPGRPIRVLHVFVDSKGLLPSIVGDEELNFGSTMPLLELSIKGGPCAEVIGHVTRLCPSLQVLSLSSASTIQIDAVSVSGTFEEASSPRRQNTFTTKYMHNFYRLKHLQHLDFKFLCHAPSNRALAWERSMGEAFRTRSTPNIHHISFSSIVEWDRVPYDTTWIPSGVGVSTNQGRNLGDHPFMGHEAQWPDAPFPLDEQ